MASDLISRDALLESFKRDFKPTLWEDKYIVQNIMSAPAVDAVEVVRCKDCAYKRIPHCCPCQLNGFQVEDDWFCPIGMRNQIGAKMDGKDTNVPTKAKDGGEQDAD